MSFNFSHIGKFSIDAVYWCCINKVLVEIKKYTVRYFHVTTIKYHLVTRYILNNNNKTYLIRVIITDLVIFDYNISGSKPNNYCNIYTLKITTVF